MSRAPLIASHSACRALANVPRNMTDQMIVELAKKGGVVQVNFYCNFLTKDKPPHATIADVVAHIDHIRKIAGIDAIGIGSDFDGIDCAPVGLEDVSKFPNLTRALLENGLLGRGHPQDLRREFPARDESGGKSCSCEIASSLRAPRSWPLARFGRPKPACFSTHRSRR